MYEIHNSWQQVNNAENRNTQKIWQKEKSALHIEKNAAKLFSSRTTTEQQVTNKIKNIKNYQLS
jgi:hypothetical protein